MLIRKTSNTQTQHLYNVQNRKYIILGTTESGRIKYIRFYREDNNGYGVLEAEYKPTGIIYLEQVSWEVEDESENYFALDTDALAYYEDRFEAVYEA